MNNNRARQFLPFNEDHAWKLSGELQLVERKMPVTVTYYDIDTYRTVTGKVEQIDKIFRVLQVAGRRIYFEDIWEVKVISCGEG